MQIIIASTELSKFLKKKRLFVKISTAYNIPIREQYFQIYYLSAGPIIVPLVPRHDSILPVLYVARGAGRWL